MGHIFISYSHKDKDYVHRLQDALQAEGFEVWIDDRIHYGSEWPKVVTRNLDISDGVIVVLSNNSYESDMVQNEVTRAREKKKPIFPLLLNGENWLIVQAKQFVDVRDGLLPKENFYERLASVTPRNKPVSTPPSPREEPKPAPVSRIDTSYSKSNPTYAKPVVEKKKVRAKKPITRIALPFAPDYSNIDFDLYRFVQIPATTEVPYSFHVGKYPVTNAQYERFLNAPDYSEATIWRGFLKFNEDCIQIGRWHEEGWDWFQEEMKDPKKFLDKKRVIPKYWNDQNFGISNPENPVVGICWFEANAYCNWLMSHWNDLSESRANTSLRPRLVRLPLESEWVIAAGGETPENRFPWDVIGSATTDIKEIVKRANIAESNIGYTTPVTAYLRGASPYGVMDMAGNVWERQMNYQSMEKGFLGLRGGSWRDDVDLACVKVHNYHESPIERGNDVGFRVAVILREHS